MPETEMHNADLDVLRQIVSAVLKVPVQQITGNARISDLALVESIKLLRIAGKIERQFGIELEDEVMFQEASLAQVADEIARLRHAQRSAAA